MSGLKVKAETYTGNVNGLYSRVIDVSGNLIHHPHTLFNIRTFVFVSTGPQGKKVLCVQQAFS